MLQPPWLDAAWQLLGAREVAGPRDNPDIVALYRDAGHPGVAHDEIAWCAAFAGAALERSGIRGSRSLMARSYLAWGERLEDGRLGAVTVLRRGADPALGHVGFWIGATRSHVVLLGGNQSNAVSVARFPLADVLGYRWPQETPAAGPRDIEAPPAAHFDRCLAHVLEMEGGYSDDPFDPGGPTNLGITLRVFAEWTGVHVDATSVAELKSQLKRIDAATVRAIYERRYWQPAGCDALPPGLSLMHFDAAVNHGVGTAIRALQEAAGTEADGEIGPRTRAAIAAGDPVHMLERYAGIRRRRYRALKTFWRFGRGWLRRVDVALERARVLAEGDQSLPESDAATKGTSPMANTPTVPAKWWGESLTVWGAIITALSTVLPALGPVTGIDLTPEMIKDAGTHIVALVQAAAGLLGTVMTIYGRVRASAPLERRPVTLKL